MKPEIQNRISAALAGLIQTTPGAEQVRGLILKETGFWLPDGMNKTESIQAWLEEQFAKPVPEPTPGQSPVKMEPIKGVVEISYSEQGSLGYSFRHNVAEPVKFTREDLEAAMDESEEWSDVFTSLKDSLNFYTSNLTDPPGFAEAVRAIQADRSVEESSIDELGLSGALKTVIKQAVKTYYPERYALLQENE